MYTVHSHMIDLLILHTVDLKSAFVNEAISIFSSQCMAWQAKSEHSTEYFIFQGTKTLHSSISDILYSKNILLCRYLSPFKLALRKEIVLYDKKKYIFEDFLDQ